MPVTQLGRDAPKERVMTQQFLPNQGNVHTIPAYFAAIQHILVVVANKFELPWEAGGYDVQTTERSSEHMVISVSAPEWGRTSGIVMRLVKDEQTRLWQPAPNWPVVLTLENTTCVPPKVRGMVYYLDVTRNPKNGRFNVKIKSSHSRTDA